MITDAIIALLSFVAQAALSGIPSQETPEWMTSASSFMPTVFSYASSMGVWFPWSLLGIVSAAVVIAWSASFLIKIGRMILSLFTGGGGSAA